MRNVIAFLGAILLTATLGCAQNKIDLDDLSHHPFETDFPSGGQLTLLICPADIHIIGSDEEKLGVRISGRDGSDATNIRARFERSGNSGELRVKGGPNNGVTITVRVPKTSNLYVRVFAGDIDVTGVAGDKNIELHAGDLRLGVGNPADYALVKASVTAGDINAPQFGESRGGLLRSFRKSGNGKYKLVAHVGAGDLVLE